MALGSNLGRSASLLRQAMDRLQAFSGATLVRSSLWQTTPVDCPPGSPLFVNAVAGFMASPDQTPESLLVNLHALEQEFGRQPKKVLNEPRALDLDLIAFGDQVRSTPQLTLPHPRATLRRFVLEPLNEIAPDLVLPGQRQTVQQILNTLRTDEILTRLD